MGDVGPGPDMRDPRHQRVYIAVDAVELAHLRTDPSWRQPLFRSGEMAEAMREKPRMAVAHDLTEIGYLADLPEKADRCGVRRQRRDFGVARQQLQCAMIVGVARLDEAGHRRALIKAAQQCTDGLTPQPRIAPGNPGQRLETMILDRRDDRRLDRPLLGGGAKGPVAHVAAGTARDLTDLGRRQAARAAPVEFAEAGEGDMVEVHVEPHSDRVGSDQVIDLAGLEHANLSIASPRAQGAEHDSGAAALPPDHLG